MSEPLTPPPAPALEPPPLFDRLRGALLEDLLSAGDLTSQALVPEGRIAEAELVAKADGVLSGIKLVSLIFQMAEQLVSPQAAGRAWDLEDAQQAAREGKTEWDSVMRMGERLERQSVRVVPLKKDGDRLVKGDVIAKITGDARALLAGERTALNLLCHLSGIATLTALHIAKIAHTRAKLVDTRKTTPLWRDLEKYAVKCGGGENHRRGLFDMILIKDNHLALWGINDPAGAVNAARAKFPNVPIEVEVTTLEGLQHVCQHSSPEFVLLDNFTPEKIRECVEWTKTFFAQSKKNSAPPQLEASGGINLETIVSYAETGITRISIGALTHSVKALDVSLELKF
jgi:nicotinate-nucleotide pyrophosphorylase (carboxylating)